MCMSDVSSFKKKAIFSIGKFVLMYLMEMLGTDIKH